MAFVVWLAFAFSGLSAADSLPNGDELVQRILERSKTLAQSTNTHGWYYDKRSFMETLDSDGKTIETTEKLYRVQVIRGVPFSRLTKIEGRDLTEAEVKKEDEREAAFRKKLSGRDPGVAVSNREAFITENLVARYRFQVLGRELWQGHKVLVLSFSVKPGWPGEEGIQDRVLNRLAGKLWVDEATADIARLEVHLTKPCSIGVLGVLGSLKECELKLSSRRMLDGTWLPESSYLTLNARMFLASHRVRVTEQSANFSRDAAQPRS